MAPSPSGTPWVVEIEDPASIRPALLHTPTPLLVPTTPAGGRRRCTSVLRGWFVGPREPRHRRETSALSWSQLVPQPARGRSGAGDRAVMAVGLACTVIGVWLGVLAPAASPVSAPPAVGVQPQTP